VTTTVSDAKGNTISQSTAAAAPTAASAGSTYARNAKAPSAATQPGALSIGV
jgi:hypothetical protein